MQVRWLGTVLVCGAFSCAQAATVTARVTWEDGGSKATRAHEAGNVVLWLTPVDSPGVPTSPPAQTSPRVRLVQKNKSFEPHVLVVPVGSLVEFPNRDPFFHNVFSLFEENVSISGCTKLAPPGMSTLTSRESHTFSATSILR